MVSQLLKEVRNSYGVVLNFAANDLAKQEPLTAFNEFQRMLNGERRTFFRKYTQEHVHTAIIGLGSTNLSTALIYLKELYVCQGHLDEGTQMSLAHGRDASSSFGIVSSPLVHYVFPSAPFNLSRKLDYSIDAPEGVTAMHHLQVRTNHHYHRMMQLSINNLERSLGLPVSSMEDFLPK